MSRPSSFQLLNKSTLHVGATIRHPLFDAKGLLVSPAGQVIQDAAMLDELRAKDLYVDSEISGDQNPIESMQKNGKDIKVETVDASKENITRQLEIGDNIQIKFLTTSGSQDAFFVKFLGGMAQRSIVCSLPVVNDRVMFIKEGSAFSVSLFSGRNVYAFTTTAEVVYSRPYPHMHLAYPRMVTMSKIRRSQRIQVNIITSFTNLSTLLKSKASGMLVDISMGGALVESTEGVGQVGHELECNFKLHINGTETFFTLPSHICSQRTIQTDSGKLVVQQGLEFDDIPYQQKILLQNFILQSISNIQLG
ncbi:flagellar brake protein [Methylovorus mays]|uniref:flagellar brake protein n=1 Tax=Methylovorus mays TaxID=184077 RepID=UPI001E36A125|nr:flagellar brake protein [Methylovorus mays]MCB5206938.1 flagellar brake protein [Methylovorus mays]